MWSVEIVAHLHCLTHLTNMSPLSQLIKEGEEQLDAKLPVEVFAVPGKNLFKQEILELNRQSTRSLLTGIIEGCKDRMKEQTMHINNQTISGAFDSLAWNAALQSVIDDLSEVLKEIK